jgi:glycosyltransferase involved in cell wall biosynthesis
VRIERESHFGNMIHMSQRAVSVAMATYNGANFLQEQLDSLARQTLLPAELVVSDDASTDGTVAILQQFAAQAPFPVRILQNETRLGFGFNFLGIIGRCAGELVAFCDQDDIWRENKLSVCAMAMSDPQISLVSHSASVFSSRSLPRPLKHPDHRDVLVRHCKDLPVHRGIPGFSMVLKRSVVGIATPPPYDSEHARWAVHDWWAVAAALSCGHIALLSDDLALYRLHDRNVALRSRATGLARMAPQPCTLEYGAEVKAGLGEFLRYAALSCDVSARATFFEYIEELDRVGRIYGERAQLHRATGHRWMAIRMLFEMLAKGTYTSRGLGIKAFVRDAFLAALWPAR